MSTMNSIVEASIADLSTALAGGRLSSVDLVAKCLLRVSVYDCRGASLNSIPLINENVFEEAAAADDRRAAGQSQGSLEGIPFTVKDTYRVSGMTVASGSEAFENLFANEDAFLVKALREAGAVLIGRTNMCPMAYGGILRGVYGRAESPYNKDYLAAAFGSGSSNGSGVSVAASFAAFGIGGETVSSGRSPASNNALVTYTPSKGLLSVRGSWPLYPTCDVAIPHTRTLDDLFILLDVLLKQDPETTGDFWRDQPFIDLPPSPWSDNSAPSTFVRNAGYLEGKRIVVPQEFLSQQDGGPYVSEAIRPLWWRAKADLEAAGAIVKIIPDLPVLRVYQEMLRKPDPADASSDEPYLPADWNATERGVLIAHAWEGFLESNHDRHIQSLTQVDPKRLFPHLPRSDPQEKFKEPANAVHWDKLASHVADRANSTRPGKSAIYDVPGLESAVRALERIRARYFEEWMSAHNFDFVAFPAAGDVARADADVYDTSAQHAWTNGVNYSHGNRALRHLGIPTITVPMGILEDSKMPMGLTFLGRAYDDLNLLQTGYAYEQNSKRRVAPPLTPPLPSDEIMQHGNVSKETRPRLSITKCRMTPAHDGKVIISIEGTVSTASASGDTFKPIVEIYIDGKCIPASGFSISAPKVTGEAPAVSDFVCEQEVSAPPVQDDRNRVVGKIARNGTMAIILARDGEHGRPSGYVKVLHQENEAVDL